LSIWAVVVWITVVYLGEHYVADVVGGVIYTAASLAIVAWVVAVRKSGRGPVHDLIEATSRQATKVRAPARIPPEPRVLKLG
jgi:hypothetical protein